MVNCVHIADIIHTKAELLRTNIEIDDKLMDDVLHTTGLKTKKDAAELGLKTLIRLINRKGYGDKKCGQLSSFT